MNSHPSEVDPAPIWLKMVPNDNPDADGFWSRSFVMHHHAVTRARAPETGAPALCYCGRMGRYDDSAGANQAYPDSVWTETSTGRVCCQECYSKDLFE